MPETYNLKTIFANNLKNRRKQLKLTQADLANKVNVSTSFITEIENARKSPSFTTIEKLASVLEAPPWSFFCERGDSVSIKHSEKEKISFALKNEINNTIDNFVKNKI